MVPWQGTEDFSVHQSSMLQLGYQTHRINICLFVCLSVTNLVTTISQKVIGRFACNLPQWCRMLKGRLSSICRKNKSKVKVTGIEQLLKSNWFEDIATIIITKKLLIDFNVSCQDSMEWCRMIKARLSWKNHTHTHKKWSKVKVTGVKWKAKNNRFKLFPWYLKKCMTYFSKSWQDGVECHIPAIQ